MPILIVEDDADLRESLREVLSTEGYAVLMAGDGQSALSILRESRVRPRLIILDVMMSGMNGAEFLEALRRDHPNDLARIPVVIATAMASAAQDACFAGLDKLNKPFDLEELLAKVAQLCDGPTGR